jgi:AcrR family transcriptional regulator
MSGTSEITPTTMSAMSWEERAFERSPAVQRSRERVAAQARLMLDAAHRLILVKGDAFTTQELAAEAGVALQTFYRYFASKDELLLAVLGDSMTTACRQWRDNASTLDDPLDRLRLYIVTALDLLDANNRAGAGTRFVVGAHWRLHRQFPKELFDAEKPFVELLREGVQDAIDAGRLNPVDSEWDPWFLSELVRSVYHYYAFAPRTEGDMEVVKDRLWHFCLTALGGART